MKLLYIDNLDSFAYTIINSIQDQGIHVEREVSTTPIELLKGKVVDYAVLGPGPNGPQDAGNYKQIIEHFLGKVPILGICLGHQTIIEYFGGRVKPIDAEHGTTHNIEHTGKGIFSNCESPMHVARYHSLGTLVDEVGSQLEVTAQQNYNNQKIVMGVRHRTYREVQGIQFHPESFLTQGGDQIFKNILEKR